MQTSGSGLKGEQRKAWMAKWRKHYAERGTFLRTERTGFVWVYYRK